MLRADSETLEATNTIVKREFCIPNEKRDLRSSFRGFCHMDPDETCNLKEQCAHVV